MTTPHVIASSPGHHSQSNTSNGIVGNQYRVGKKIGEGSFGVVFEGTPFQTILSPPLLEELDGRLVWWEPTEVPGARILQGGDDGLLSVPWP